MSLPMFIRRLNDVILRSPEESGAGSENTIEGNVEIKVNTEGETETVAEVKSPEEIAAAAALAEAEVEKSKIKLPPKAPAEDYRQKRIDKLTARLRESEAELVKVKALAGNPALSDEAEIERRAAEKATAIASAKLFSDACNEARRKGDERFGKDEMQKSVDSLAQLVDRNDPESIQSYNAFLQAALETGAPEKVIFELGADLNEAARVLGLSPVKMAVELTRKAYSESPETMTQTKRPITPVAGGRGTTHANIRASEPEQGMKLSTAEWMKRREAEAAEYRKSRGR